jgi:hypothetical protein
VTAKKFKALSADKQIEVLALQAWHLRREKVRLMREMEHIDVLALSQDKLGKYLDHWQDLVREIEGYAFNEWLALRTEQHGMNLDKLSPRGFEQLVEESRPEWNATPDSIKAQMLRKSLRRPNIGTR